MASSVGMDSDVLVFDLENHTSENATSHSDAHSNTKDASYGHSNSIVENYPSRPHFPLQCIFFSEFDVTVGPRLLTQFPSDILSAELFSSLSAFFIPPSELSHKLLTIYAFQYAILCYPIHLSASKYPRNALLFSVGFLFARSAWSSIQTYAPLLRKLAHTIETCEIESELIFRAETKSTIPSILRRVYAQLNTVGECAVPIDDVHHIHLKLYPLLSPPEPVKPWHVPVATWPTLFRSPIPSWDITLRELLPYLDGVSHVGLLARKSGISIGTISRCIEQLVYANVCSICDIFQFTNQYECDGSTKGLHTLYHSQELQTECINYIVVRETSKINIQPKTLFRLYSGLRRDVTLASFIHKHRLEDLNIDVRKFITFGLLNRIIRRVHCYPILADSNDIALKSYMSKAITVPQDVLNQKVVSPRIDENLLHQNGVAISCDDNWLLWCDGTRCFDELQWRWQLTYAELAKKVQKEPRLTLIRR